MNDTTTIALRYGAFALDGLRMDGEIWLRDHQIGAPLGFAHQRAVLNLYNRHRDEFTADETRLIVEQTEGGPQQVRVFSLRGSRWRVPRPLTACAVGERLKPVSLMAVRCNHHPAMRSDDGQAPRRRRCDHTQHAPRQAERAQPLGPGGRGLC